jgi:alcohol dehydrogenase (cytochrome c)
MFLAHRTLRSPAGGLVVLALMAAPSLQAQVTQADIANDATTTNDVVTVGLGTQGQRFSPLAKINTGNAAKLVPAWAFSFGGEKQRGQESQPLVTKDGKIFVTASYSRLFAIDARTGKGLWEYDQPLPEGIRPCCDFVNRGAALYENLVIFGTLDAMLVALDQASGKVVWKDKLGDFEAGYSYTAAPLIVGDKVITGVSGGEFGIVGRVDARDAKTGKLIWSRPTVEGNMGYLNGQEAGVTGETNKTWPGDLYKYGGAATWLGGTYDPETKLIFFGTGNPAPWNAHVRPGDNLYSTSTVALRPEDGKLVWYYQSTPNDTWDYDGTCEFISFDLNEGGKVIKAGAKADRNGFFYVIDRTNGKLIRAFPFARKITWASGVDPATGRPTETNNRPGTPAGDSAGTKGTKIVVAPSFLGAKNWEPMSYNPETGLFYVAANEMQMDLWNEPVTYKRGAAYLGAGFTVKPIFPDYIGALRAIDPKAGRIVWEYKNVAPLWGGTLTTKGGLVFTGTPEGYFKAFDAKTGKELWAFQTGSGVVGQPITWEQDGAQYVAVTSGWGGAVPLWGGEVAKSTEHITQGGSLWVFKLAR